MGDRIEKLKEFLRENPNDSFVLHALALEYVKLGNDAQAKELFIQILDRDPGYIGSYYHLGKLYEREGAIDEALKVYKTGILTAEGAEDRRALNELQAAYEDLM
ncbi:MAG TPA: tetratricopeptide repeat protein [Chitinophagaceae bacterium]|nr:tetratricopeptide repeat protein [Chitinophagaceae bacterium]